MVLCAWSSNLMNRWKSSRNINWKLAPEAFFLLMYYCRTQWPRGLRHGSATALFLGLRGRISQGASIFVSNGCCVLSGIGLCVWLITSPEESWRVCNWVPPHPGHEQAASSVIYTTSCKHNLVLLRMCEIIARNMLSWLKLLIKLLLLHLVGCLYYLKFLLQYFKNLKLVFWTYSCLENEYNF